MAHATQQNTIFKTSRMRFDILSIFPGMFSAYLDESMIKRAQSRKLLTIAIHDIRDFSKDPHKKTDDIPYGGGPGMLMTPQPLYDAIIHAKKLNPKAKVIYLSPAGKILTHKRAQKLASNKGLILVCGRYEGVDQRIRDLLVDEEYSIGKYVMTGGELPAMVIIDTVARFIPGVVGKSASVEEESFSEALEGKKEYPHYTRPPIFKGLKVPDVLISGHHKKIAEWRKKHVK